MTAFRSILVLLSIFALRVWAQCKAYGVDFSHGGTYNIDASSNEYFSFYSVFLDCNQEVIEPVLVSPDGNQYGCTGISTTPGGQQVESECGIPYSAMSSGQWTIILQGTQVAVQRTINLIVGVPETVTKTATPTVVVGITSTLSAITVQSTVTQTQTLILPPQTVTSNCGGGGNGGTRTVTSYAQAPTETITQTLTRTQTDGQQTSFWTTTMVTTAMCHLPSSGSSDPTSIYEPEPSETLVAEEPEPSTSFEPDPIVLTPTTTTTTTTSSAAAPVTTTSIILPPSSTARPSFCIGAACFPPRRKGRRANQGSGHGMAAGRPSSNLILAAGRKREAAPVTHLDERDLAAVAATTVTVTAETTVTQTIINTVPATTTTEMVITTTIATVSPPPSTVCNGQAGPTATVTAVIGGGNPITQTNIIYTTTHLSGTVWVGQTEYSTSSNTASASACWRAGGWYGL